MFDGWKVILGLIIFLAVVTFPLWYNASTGKATDVPEVEIPVELAGQQCILDRESMRASHMDLLNEWRDDVVRRGDRIYEAPDGKKHVMSLQNTCMGCHQNKSAFCDRCHNYMAVTPYCWECHIEPKESL